MSETIQLHVIITGKVQGVFFRAETKRAADSLKIKGWVKNLPDGGVEALLEGGEDAVGQMMDWCRHGPPSATVDQVRTLSTGSVSGFSSFKIRY